MWLLEIWGDIYSIQNHRTIQDDLIKHFLLNANSNRWSRSRNINIEMKLVQETYLQGLQKVLIRLSQTMNIKTLDISGSK